MTQPQPSIWRRSASLGATVALALGAVFAGGAASAETEPPPDETNPPVAFTDITTDSKFYDEIMWLAEQGISTGYSEDDTFRPFWPVTRDAMAAFMYRLAGEPDFAAPEEPPFEDITVDTKFYKEITWLESTGVTTGFADNGYKPYQPVTRDAMAAFLYRLAGAPEYTPPVESPFADITPESKFYKEISWLAEEGISTGWTVDNTYRPFESIERNAMAAFMYRFDAGVGVGVGLTPPA